MVIPAIKSSGRKALSALAFAGAMLNLQQLPVQSQAKSELTESVIQQIVANTIIGPEDRAYYLLKVANSYICGDNAADIESQYGSIAFTPTKTGRRAISPLDFSIASWTNQLSSEESSAKQEFTAKTEAKSATKPIFSESSLLANTAIKEALKQLGKSPLTYEQLNMYFIASRLYKKLGNVDGMSRCNIAIELAIHAAEESSPAIEKQIMAASSILNLMANCLISVPKPNPTIGGLPAQAVKVKPFTEADFKKSEKLKLRAVAMVDKLNAQNDLRRKTHRDLSLWYKQLGKMELANKEKHILFDLVGIEDDSILYPQAAGCGHEVWWQRPGKVLTYGCGMG